MQSPNFGSGGVAVQPGFVNHVHGGPRIHARQLSSPLVLPVAQGAAMPPLSPLLMPPAIQQRDSVKEVIGTPGSGVNYVPIYVGTPPKVSVVLCLLPTPTNTFSSFMLLFSTLAAVTAGFLTKALPTAGPASVLRPATISRLQLPAVQKAQTSLSPMLMVPATLVTMLKTP